MFFFTRPLSRGLTKSHSPFKLNTHKTPALFDFPDTFACPPALSHAHKQASTTCPPYVSVYVCGPLRNRCVPFDIFTMVSLCDSIRQDQAHMLHGKNMGKHLKTHFNETKKKRIGPGQVVWSFIFCLQRSILFAASNGFSHGRWFWFIMFNNIAYMSQLKSRWSLYFFLPGTLPR